jgi:hypothetical protein
MISRRSVMRGVGSGAAATAIFTSSSIPVSTAAAGSTATPAWYNVNNYSSIQAAINAASTATNLVNPDRVKTI